MCQVSTTEMSERKRKLEEVVELSGDDAGKESPFGSADVEVLEPDAKILHVEPTASQSSDSNLEFVTLNSQTSQSSVDCVEILPEEPAVDLKQKLLELDDEIRFLRAENEELRSKSCSCRPKTSTDQIINIFFSSVENFRLYKDKLTKLFKKSVEFCIEENESDLLIGIGKDNDIDPDEWVVISNADVKIIEKAEGRLHKRKKKKAKHVDKDEEEEDEDEADALDDSFFKLDTTPSLSTKNNLKYESKFSVINAPHDDKIEAKPAPASVCFNCNENHNLRDCPKPKNFNKINAARQKFKAQQQNKSLRYHMEDDQRFGTLRPGKISDKLHDALGLRHNQLPPHIYRMRQLGYPPGWFNEILAVQQSNLVLFDFEGKGAFNRKKTVQDVDPDKIVEYPGFNMPMDKGIRDEHRLYGCLPYSEICKRQSKESILEYVRGMQKKAEDNLESCDMDLDTVASDKEVEHIIRDDKQVTAKDLTISPTLLELESEKLKLLDQLTEDTSNISQAENTSNISQAEETNGSSDAAFQTLDITGTVDEFSDSITQQTEKANDSSLVATPIAVKSSSFGTPVLKSASPFCRLPCAENFSKDVSEVINFENLPNSTGKYEQMVGVLEKVRKTLKGLNDSQS